MEIAIYNDVYAETVAWFAEHTRLTEPLLLAAHDIAKGRVASIRRRVAVRQLGDIATTYADHRVSEVCTDDATDACDICDLLDMDKQALLAIVGR